MMIWFKKTVHFPSAWDCSDSSARKDINNDFRDELYLDEMELMTDYETRSITARL